MGKNADRLPEAVAFLKDLLAYGRMESKYVFKEAAAVGISARTLERAKRLLPLVAVQWQRQWYWMFESHLTNPDVPFFC